MKVTKEQQIEILAYMLDNVKPYENKSPYAKVPVRGRTGLWFCHPGYLHSDYNKWRACDLEDNELFCNIVLDIWKGLTEQKTIRSNLQSDNRKGGRSCKLHPDRLTIRQ